jgi:threonine synthase
VPTGNFGNVFAAWSVRHMGLKMDSLTIASNRNDILTRFFETGEMKLEGVEPSLSPSMDIQVSSNFERYLFELLGRDSDHLNRLMKQFRETGSFRVDAALHKAARAEFNAMRCSDDDTLATMKQCHAETGILIDPHTAVALYAAQNVKGKAPMVIVSTAHPAKFPEAVHKATGITPPVPPALQSVMKKAEHLIGLPNDYQRVASFIRANINA